MPLVEDYLFCNLTCMISLEKTLSRIWQYSSSVLDTITLWGSDGKQKVKKLIKGYYCLPHHSNNGCIKVALNGMIYIWNGLVTSFSCMLLFTLKFRYHFINLHVIIKNIMHYCLLWELFLNKFSNSSAFLVNQSSLFLLQNFCILCQAAKM